MPGLWARDLAAILRGADLPVLEVAGWQGRGRGPLDAVDCIIVHHTASGAQTGAFPSRNVLVNGRPDLPGPLAQLAVTRPVPGQTAMWACVAAGLANHAGAVRQPWQANAHALGVECENDGVGERWAPVLLDVLARGLAALAVAYDVPTARILGHREVCDPPGRKIDPTTSMIDLRAAVARERTRLENPLMALTDDDARKIGKAVVAELLGLDTIPDLGARARGATGTDATVSLRTVLAHVFAAAQRSNAQAAAPAPVAPPTAAVPPKKL